MDLQQIRDFINNLEEKQFYNYLAIVLGTIIFFMSLIIIQHYNQIRSLKKRVVRINTSREITQDLLARYEVVKKQRDEVDMMLDKNKDFRIKGYFSTLLNTIGLTANLTQEEPESSEEDLEEIPGYTEVKIEASFNNINTQQLCQLLQELEKNERIYTKYLEITKSTNTPTLGINLTIATLRKQPEIAERTE